MRRNPSRYSRQQKELHAPKPSSSAKYNGITTRKRKPHGNVKIPFEKNILTYLLAFPKLEGELHLKGVSLSRPRFFKELKFHHAFMAYCISNLFQSFELYSSENIVKCPFSQVLDTKAFRKKVFYK
jgi:hypothetical protein